MSVVCPKCGVAVVPGYVRCPKCQSPLPQRASTTAAGGTSVSSASGSGGFPIVPLAIVVVLIGALVALAASRGGAKTATADPATAVTPPPADPVTRVNEPDLIPAPATRLTAPDPTPAISALDRALTSKRLWGTVEVVGARVDVRSASCADPAMGPVIDAAIPRLKSVGLTKLRCLEQAGAVVFQRDL